MNGDSQWMGWGRTAGHGLWIVIQVLIMLYALWVVVYIVGRQLMEGDDWGFIGATHNLAPWFGPIGVVLLVVTLLFSPWRWPFVLLLAPGLIAFAIWHGQMLLPPPDVSVPEGSTVINVAAFNILSPSSDPDEIPDAIRAMGEMDIVGLEEVGAEHAAVIDRELSSEFPYRLLYPGEPVYEGVALLSRYPIVSDETYKPQSNAMLHLRAELDVDGTPLVVYVIHPWPPEHRRNPFKYDSTRRSKDLQGTLERLRQEDGPVLVLCDCNMPDQSADYADMDALLDDAFREIGWGFGFTFPAYRKFIPSLIRIDYVWHNEYLVALSAETAAKPGTSDHRPIQAELALSAEPQ